MLKHSVASIAAALALSASAVQAADLPVKAPPMVAAAPAFSWTGFYIGVSGGFGWGRTGVILPPPPPLPPPSSSDIEPETDGGAIGGMIAWLYQAPNTNFVFGVAADGHASFIEGEHRSGASFYRAETDGFGSVRGIAGFAIGRTFVYGTGGFGWIRNTITAGTDLHFVHDTQTHTGFVFGGGGDFAVNDRVSVGILVLHYEVGDKDYHLYSQKTVGSELNVVTGHVKYRLGGGN